MLAERTMAGDGGVVVMSSNPARSLDFFFFHFRKFSKLFGRLVCRWLLEALNFRHSLILYDHVYSYLRSIISLILLI